MGMGVVERLRHARLGRGETLESVARRTGTAERLLRAIDEGRFDELPRGLYARAAIRSYATALGLDPAEILLACEPLLPVMVDPIIALGRLRGGQVIENRATEARTTPGESTAAADPEPGEPGWRLPAAAGLDAVLLGGLAAVLIAGAALVAHVPFAALRDSSPVFGLTSVFVAGSYFIWFGGISGTTVGKRSVGLPASAPPIGPLDLRTIFIRAAQSATEDLRFIHGLGLWLGRIGVQDGTGPHHRTMTVGSSRSEV